jgi:hypothetical protein
MFAGIFLGGELTVEGGGASWKKDKFRLLLLLLLLLGRTPTKPRRERSVPQYVFKHVLGYRFHL